MELSGIGHSKQRGAKHRGFAAACNRTLERSPGQWLVCWSIICRFKKAFDSVNRDILKRKLQAAGFYGALYDWMCDYRSQRMQHADVNRKTSTIKEIEFGVRQGSLLVPHLFSIHVNDLTDSITKGELVMFVDDTTIFCINDNIEEEIYCLNASANELLNWCNRNQLAVHTYKTEQ